MRVMPRRNRVKRHRGQRPKWMREMEQRVVHATMNPRFDERGNFERRVGLVVAGILLVFFAVGVVLAEAESVVDRTPPCVYEDGSGSPTGRCVWDARHMGNGEGRSLLFRNDAQDVVVIGHRRAHRLMVTSR